MKNVRGSTNIAGKKFRISRKFVSPNSTFLFLAEENIFPTREFRGKFFEPRRWTPRTINPTRSEISCATKIHQPRFYFSARKNIFPARETPAGNCSRPREWTSLTLALTFRSLGNLCPIFATRVSLGLSSLIKLNRGVYRIALARYFDGFDYEPRLASDAIERLIFCLFLFVSFARKKTKMESGGISRVEKLTAFFRIEDRTALATVGRDGMLAD